MRSIHGQGVILGLVVLALDQISKGLIVANFHPLETRHLVPHIDLTLVFNRGISFGLLNSGSPMQLIGLGALLATIFLLLIWQFSSVSARFPALCYGGIMGGAVGNVVDRFRYGAVVDFIDFSIKNLRLPFYNATNWHWPAFNIADSAIVVGVAGLLFYQLHQSHSPKKISGKRAR